MTACNRRSIFDYIAEIVAGKYGNPFLFSGIFILWILLNHRLFFRKEMRGSGSPVECGFESQIENFSTL